MLNYPNKISSTLPIGIFDSGVGGISVLADIYNILPNETYLYYADSFNAPYGEKSVKEIQKLALKVANFLIKKKIKALVVACNTATSAAIDLMRSSFSIPVIGMEPALKPAVEKFPQGKIVIIATPITLEEKKYQLLLKRFYNQAQIYSLPCPTLVELIEQGITEGSIIDEELNKIFFEWKNKKLDVIVLGCTHFPFIRKSLQNFFPTTQLIDGNKGTAQQLKRILEEENLLNIANNKLNYDKKITFYTSGDEEKILPLCRKLLEN